jgi:hypothetical protein
MHRTPSHIPGIFFHKRAFPSFVHHTGIVPHDQIPLVLPLDADHVLVLRSVREQSLDELGAFGLRHPLVRLLLGRHKVRRPRCFVLQMVHVVRDVEVLAPAGPVGLQNLVSAKGVFLGVDVSEPFTVLGRGLFARVHKAVCPNVVVLLELSAQVCRKLVVSGAGVGKVGVAASATWWQLMCS